MQHARNRISSLRSSGHLRTGKTTYLSRQISKAVEAHGSDAIIISSFTRAAAAELVGRDLPVDRERIGTLHAHCFRAIGRPRLAETKLEFWNSEYPQLALHTKQVDPDDPHGDEQSGNAGQGDELLMIMQSLRARMVRQEIWPARVQSFHNRWEDWKERYELMDFSDLLDWGLENLKAAPGNPTIGFFDEGQDFVPCELKLVRQWTEHMDHAIIAGDDDQALYKFRGATPEAFLEPKLPAEQVRVLSRSYRLPSKIHEYSEAWVKQLSLRQPKEYVPDRDGGEVKRIYSATYQQPKQVVELAARHADEGKSVMILAACAYMLKPAIQELKEMGLPFHNPYRKRRQDWNPLRASRGSSMAQRILALLRPFETVYGKDARLWTVSELRVWVDIIASSAGVLARGAKERLKRVEGDDIVTVDLLNEVFVPEEFEKFLYEVEQKPLDWLRDRALKSRRRLLDYPINIANRNGNPLVLAAAPLVTTGTVHSVKGGEADVVIVFPDLSKPGMVEYCGAPKQKDSIIRQFYVAFTRTRDLLYLCGPSGAMRVVFR